MTAPARAATHGKTTTTETTMRTYKGRRYGQVWALWHGGSSYGLPALADAETFPGLREARRAFEDRYHNMARPLTPCVDDSATMRIYLADPAELRDPYPEWEITVRRTKAGEARFPIAEC